MASPTDPVSQFEIHKQVELNLFGFDVSITNSTIMMWFAAVLILAMMFFATSKRNLVPGRLQSLGEMSYEFIANMIRSTAGTDGLKFFPFVFTLFMFILFANLIGMFPIFFTTTSHLIVTFAMAMTVILIVLGYGLFKHGLGFFKLFAPSGVPPVLYLLVVPLEVISFISRPISLSMRLWANMLAGHILLKLFAGFTILMATSDMLAVKGLSILPFFMTFALTPLEFLVAFLQAYVFAILTCVYLSDALHPSH